MLSPRPASAQTTWTDRGYVNISGFYQPSSSFSTTAAGVPVLPTIPMSLAEVTLAAPRVAAPASLSEIAQVLRHRSPNTTAIYAKVDHRALGELARVWPGGAT